ncbi:ParM/StbA family protein [Bacillus cereus]|nr:ParM/StbA family protein [Bacillus cereus]
MTNLNVLNISRFNGDFGNSNNNFMLNGYYFEMPTNVAPISKKRAETFFVDAINEPKDLLKKMLISTTIDGEEQYFLVGEVAVPQTLSNEHVKRMHDKIDSPIPYVSFLSAVAYYHALNAKPEDTDVEIDYMSMMLPIWLLKRESKFSVAQNKMSNRFLKEHIVTVHTPGMERTLKITVKQAKCRIESEIARHSIKYRMVKKETDNTKAISIEKRKSAAQFENSKVVLVDIGGGSTDAVGLGVGLTTPTSRDSFKVIDIKPYLGNIEEFRTEKFIEQFTSLRSFENFIVKHYNTQTYKLKNENTGTEIDLTDSITEMLNDYAALLVTQVLNAFIPASSDEVLKFVYFGGEAPILEPYIKENLLDHMSETAANSNHFFLDEIIEEEDNEVFAPTARTINLNALELRSIDETKKVEA